MLLFPLSYQKSEHSFWLFDVASNVGTQYTDDSKGDYSQDCYSFTRTSTQCLIAPSYTDDLVQELNTWVNKNNDSEYGHLCKWTYEYVDGYARPKLIPED